MADAEPNLFREHVKNSGGRLAHAVSQIHRIELTPGEISWKKNFSDPVDNFDDTFSGWNRLIIDMGIAFPIIAGFNDFFSDPGKLTSELRQIVFIDFTCITFDSSLDHMDLISC
jgi:hypothetical protein